jgi:RNA polymerase sigma-70 factor (ECF subfamily)
MPLDEDLAADEITNTARAAEHRLAQECLQKALSMLTEEQRQVIVLKFVEGLTNLEAAEILGKNEGSVKSLQHRALAALHRIMEQEDCYEPTL